MPGKSHIGKAGHLAVMSELALRGYNVAMPEIDIGDDIFVVNDSSGAMWRIQVKTSSETKQKNSSRYQFRTRLSSITTPQTPDLHFVFVMRHQDRWRYAVVDRSVLNNYVAANNLGSQHNGFLQIAMTLSNAGQLTASGITLTHHLENWATWPPL